MLMSVILSDAAGTRLWPFSRKGHPELFMELGSGSEIRTLTKRDYYLLSKGELVGDRIDAGHHGVYLREPTGRKTAPAVALAAPLLANYYGRVSLKRLPQSWTWS